MFVVDIETTGLCGISAGDKIVEVGISEITGGKVIPVYHKIVAHPDIYDYSESWVFKNTDLTPEMVKNGTPEEEVISDLHKILDGQLSTSYNVYFDFTRFLNQPPYEITPIIPFDIMEIATAVICPDASPFVRSEYAYKVACPEDPAGLKFKQTHRALDDAIMEAHILTHLLGIGGKFRGRYNGSINRING